ncbi:DUF4091 domain-containing protein [Barnesiella intestinihominis]|uniref:DUF4091 domain-containing protein n=1 Tax=Barnesiella intestinihominis TaxID=487174 RepID=UPI000D7AC1EE|nr:MAG: hypothetical protein DBY05_04395 [Clostridiales bacterium]
MKCEIYSSMEWIYPDQMQENGTKNVNLYVAKNSSECFQILTDYQAKETERITYSFTGDQVGKLTLFQLLPAHVPENCAKELYTTTNYEEVKDFVTKKAPFDVYEICRPIENETLERGRVALFARLDVAKTAKTGEYTETLHVEIGENRLDIQVKIKIYSLVIPSLESANLSQTNWLFCDNVAKHHNVETWSEAHLEILKEYLRNQLDLRNDYLMIPAGKPVCDEMGKVVDFDFTEAEIVGNLALEMGMKYITGGFAIKWKVWNLPQLYLKWNELDVKTEEAQRQLHLYYKRCSECLKRNGWGEKYLQCILDEVQEYSMDSYALVSRIVKAYLPDVKINDPVETFDAVDYVDIMVSKQVSYEAKLAEYRREQEKGANIWIYTCAFPAGRAMKRIIDLPLATTRLPIWLCYKYGLKGFLCWGYNVHTPMFEKNTCLGAGGNNKLQAGDGFIVYPGQDGRPWNSVRAHVQRMAMEDFELLYALGKTDKAFVLSCIEELCRSFTDYETDSKLFYNVRKKILERLG